MNNAELERILKSAAAPAREPEFWGQLPRRVTTELHWRERRAGEFMLKLENSRRFNWMAWGLSAGLACLVIGFALGNWRGTKQAKGLLQNEKVVREVLAMFPNQVRAIVQDENGLRLLLADEPDVPASTPLWIQVCDGRRCRSIVTFSGQSVQIAGERVEVLADARGGVMLMGDHFFWSSQEIARNDRLRIDVQLLLNHVL